LISRGGEIGIPACRQAGAQNMWYVYILKSKNKNYYYKGLTQNLEERLKRHLKGLEKSTKRYLPLILIHAEICKTRIDARSLEKYFKSGYGREIIKEIFISN
jgi:putative endonuclease